MTQTRILGLAALLLVGSAPTMAQAPKISGLVQVWYTQMLDNNLRLNSTSVAPNKYYNLRSEFQENGFNIRRTEIKLAGTITDDVEYEVMFDPSIGASNSNILQDAVIKYKLMSGVEVKVGQFKNQQTLEGLTSSSELLFVERSQMGRVFGDARDRGAVVSFDFGDKEFGGKLLAGLFNGAGKAADLNAQKDAVLRAEFTLGKTIKFGAYTLQGSTDLSDKAPQAARTFQGGVQPSLDAVRDNKDKTSQMGGYFQYQDDAFHLSAEAITGELGRRFSALGTGAALREHLDQKFLGFVLTGGYTFGNHTLLARYDTMNYNQGDRWYTTINPYVVAGQGDFTPKFTELTVGYLYAFKPEKVKAANIKVNYINRSKNFLKPRAGQSGEQGGDTVAVAFQISF